MDPRVFCETDVPRTEFENEIVSETLRLLEASNQGIDPVQIRESWKVLLEKCERDRIWFIDARDAFWVFGSAYHQEMEHGEPDISLVLKVLDHPGLCPPAAGDALLVHSQQVQLCMHQGMFVGVEAGLRNLGQVLDHGMGFATHHSTINLMVGLLVILTDLPGDGLEQGCKSLLLRILDYDNHSGRYVNQVNAARTNQELEEIIVQISQDPSYASSAPRA
jgi:hypothetical protein